MKQKTFFVFAFMFLFSISFVYAQNQSVSISWSSIDGDKYYSPQINFNGQNYSPYVYGDTPGEWCKLVPQKNYIGYVKSMNSGTNVDVVKWENEQWTLIPSSNNNADEATMFECKKTTPPPQPTCYDTDEGLNYFLKGMVQAGNQTIGVDYCSNVSEELVEYYCSNSSINYVYHGCQYGCFNGACSSYDRNVANNTESNETYEDESNETTIQTNLTEDYSNKSSIDLNETFIEPNGTIVLIEPNETTGPIELNLTETNGTGISLFCSGCELNNMCYPLGYRKENKYCSEDRDFISQKESSEGCENNFECSSNLCINDQCVSGSLWAKFIRWFSNIFG